MGLVKGQEWLGGLSGLDKEVYSGQMWRMGGFYVLIKIKFFD